MIALVSVVGLRVPCGWRPAAAILTPLRRSPVPKNSQGAMARFAKALSFAKARHWGH